MPCRVVSFGTSSEFLKVGHKNTNLRNGIRDTSLKLDYSLLQNRRFFLFLMDRLIFRMIANGSASVSDVCTHTSWCAPNQNSSRQHTLPKKLVCKDVPHHYSPFWKMNARRCSHGFVFCTLDINIILNSISNKKFIEFLYLKLERWFGGISHKHTGAVPRLTVME